MRSFFCDWREGAVLFMAYQWGKPQPRASRGECGGGKTPLLIRRRKDKAGSLGAEQKIS